MLKITGQESFRKDPNTGAVINIDDKSYSAHKAWKINQLKNQNVDLEISQIKSEISEIKTLLLELLKSNASTNS